MKKYGIAGFGIAGFGLILITVGILLYFKLEDYVYRHRDNGSLLIVLGVIFVVVGSIIVAIAKVGNSHLTPQAQSVNAPQVGGQYASVISSQIRYCAYCGRSLTYDMSYCPACGHPIQGGSAEEEMNKN